MVWLKSLHIMGASIQLDHIPYRSGSEILNQPNVKLANSVTSEFVALILSLGYTNYLATHNSSSIHLLFRINIVFKCHSHGLIAAQGS